MTFRLAITAAVTLSLSGCITANMWDKNSPNTSKAVHHSVATDKIHSFGIVNQNNSQLDRGSIIMMGEKYWFVINTKDSENLADILNVKLDKQFQIVNSDNYDKSLRALPVELRNEKEADFTSKFCLRYDTHKTDEVAKLKNLSFKTENSKNKTFYYRCVHANGKYYATPKNLPADYKFEQSVPVSISYTTYKDHFSGAKLAGNIVKTPFTLAADAIGSVILIPFLMFGGSFVSMP